MAQISESTAGFNDRDIVPALSAIAAAGFSQAEISSQPPHMSSPLHGNDLKLFQELLKVCGVGASTVHAPMRENVLGAPEESWRREKVGVIFGSPEVTPGGRALKFTPPCASTSGASRA